MQPIQNPDRRAVVGGAVGAAGLMAAASAGAAAPAPIVELADGKLRGFRNGEILVFKGVPYGDTTAGENRFSPPRPVWSSTSGRRRWATAASGR